MAGVPERLSDMERASGALWSDDALMGYVKERMLEKSQLPHRLPKEKLCRQSQAMRSCASHVSLSHDNPCIASMVDSV
jgi:hypothetical protein